MGPIKIIFFDVDGTLIDLERKQISSRTLKCLRRLQARGILLCMATGRAPVSLPVLPNFEFDCYLTFNGSYCYRADETIHHSPLDAADLERFLVNAECLGRPVAIAGRQTICANGLDQDLRDYFALAKLELPLSSEFERLLREPVYQLMLGCRKTDYPALLSGTQSLKIVAWWERAADVIAASSGKGIGLNKILDFYGLSAEEALAFGDGINDIDMLQVAGCGVAMGNAADQVKAAADDICASCAEDGVYFYCLKHGLLG